MSTSSLATIIATMVDEFGIGRRGTNTGTSDSAITDDANLGGPDAAKDISVGCQLLVTADDGAAPEGEITNLASRPKLSTGVAQLDPALTTALDNAATYAILYKPLRFIGGGVGVIDKINEAQNTFQWIKRYVPITLVPDGDMLSSAITDWGAASNGTMTKVDATFPYGERTVNLEASGVGGYILSATIAVEPSKSYYLEVTGYLLTTGSGDAGTLALFDETNSAAITVPDNDITQQEPTILTNNITMPATCEQVSIRLTSTGADDDVRWANLIFRKNEHSDFTLTDRPQRPIAIGNLGFFVGSDWGARGEFEPVDTETVALGAGLWRLTTDVNLSGRSVWYEEFVPPIDLAASTVATASTPIPHRELAAVASELVLRPLSLKSKEWAKRYEYAQSRAAGVVQDYLRTNRVITNKAPKRYVTPAM